MPREIKICRARPGDAIGILEVFIYAWESANPKLHGDLSAVELLEMYSQESIKEKQRIIQTLPDNEFILTARMKGNIIAFVRGRIDELENIIIGLFVLPQFQHKGIGTRLWSEAMNHFDMEKPVVVDVSVTNEPAVRFYTKLGFLPEERRPENGVPPVPEVRFSFNWHPKKHDILL